MKKDTNWSGAATNQRIPRIVGSYEKLGKSKGEFFL